MAELDAVWPSTRAAHLGLFVEMTLRQAWAIGELYQRCPWAKAGHEGLLDAEVKRMVWCG